MSRWERIISIAIVSLLTVLLVGCAKDSPTPESVGLDTEISDPATGVTIRTHVDDPSISTAERVILEVVIQWASPATVLLIEPDWNSAGWTLVDTHRDPVERTQTGFTSTSAYTIEPFLPGEYSIPPVSIEITPTDGAQSHRLDAVPMNIQVNSVLNLQDAGTLDPADGFLDPRATQAAEPTPNTRYTWVVAIIVLALVVVVWRLIRKNPTSRTDSVYSQLQRVANEQAGERAEAFRLLHRTFNRLDRRLQQTSEIQTLIEQCERARFSPLAQASFDPQTLARHTLELLGVNGSELS